MRNDCRKWYAKAEFVPDNVGQAKRLLNPARETRDPEDGSGFPTSCGQSQTLRKCSATLMIESAHLVDGFSLAILVRLTMILAGP